MIHPELTQIGVAVVEHEGRFLIGVRGGEDSLTGLAEFPGGKCDPDEKPRDAALRECREETGLLVVPVRELQEQVWKYPEATVELHFWLCHPTQPEFIEEHHQGFRWVTREELLSHEFPPANEEVLKILTSEE